MISSSDFVRLLKIEHKLLQSQCEGLTQADTLIQPQPSGNCMNWVLGHLLDSQIVLLKALGPDSPVDAAELERYQRNSDPILGEGPGVWTLERLLAGHDQVFDAITARLTAMSEADFAEEILIGERKMERGWRVFFLHFHYTYHIGQLELLRQLAGKTDKII